MTIHCFTNPTDACDQLVWVTVRMCMQIDRSNTTTYSKNAILQLCILLQECMEGEIIL